MIRDFLADPLAIRVIQVFCRVLLHSLWQGLLLSLLAGLVISCTKGKTPALRYNLLVVLFLLFLSVCGLTFIRQWTNFAGGEWIFPVSFTENGLLIIIRKTDVLLSVYSPLIMLLWFFVFLVKCMKMTGSLICLRRLRTYGVRDTDAWWGDKVKECCARLHIKRKIALLESALVKVPVVIGHFKPVILIPLGLLTALPPGEVEAVLWHELAHVRRHDYLVNFLQVIAENIFFFNPGLLWISSLLREERENCCDDLAVDHTMDKAQYIRALVSFKENALSSVVLAPAFPGRKNQLLQRSLRILHNRNHSLNPSERIFLLLSCCLLLFLFMVSTKAPQDPVIPRNIALLQDQILLRDHNLLRNRTFPKGTLLLQEEDIEISKEAISHDAMIQDAKMTEQLQQMAEAERARLDAILAGEEALQAERDRDQTGIDQEQIRIDQEQVRADREQAERDLQQAEEDRIQTIRDQSQAMADHQKVEEFQKK